MELRIFSSIEEIAAQDWQALTPQDFPFADHAFFLNLEKSRSIAGHSGWKPFYLTLWEDKKLVAALPLFEKSHSYGEFIFDWAWAEAYHRHGLAYYPKLCAATPMTPASGPKLLSLSHEKENFGKELIRSAQTLLGERQNSGLHFLFIPEDEIPIYQNQGFLIRHSYQYHWHNLGYQSFADFLAVLKRKRRQQIVSERKKVEQLGLQIELFIGSQIQKEHLEAMMSFYFVTHQQKGSPTYLQPEFFLEMEAALKQQCMIILAKEGQDWVAGAIFFFKGKNLYGRYWGAMKDYPFLHFELCYYRPIEWAIAQGFQKVEAGAQGEHKFLRGFEPTLTYSAHYLRHQGFQRAIGDFIEAEKLKIQDYFRGMEELSPYQIISRNS